MKNIKFRGKRKGSNTGEHALDWAYGDLVKELSTGKCFICDISHAYKDTELDDVLIEVEPETVGQYTGLKDKNGKEIYEGDIVKTNDFYECGELVFKGKTEVIENILDYINTVKSIDTTGEVIGNIYENPELLKKGVK